MILLASALFLLFATVANCDASAAASCAPSVHDSAAFLATGSPSVHDPCDVFLAFGSPSILLFLAPLAAAAFGGLWDGFCEYSGIVRDNKEIILLE